MKNSMKRLFPFSWQDLLITAGVLLCAVSVCIPLRMADSSPGFAPPVFVLAVLVISRLTAGYLYGLIASVLGVVCVNIIFTYPYLAFNLTIAGYPLAFLSFLAVSLITSALTTRITQLERLRAESEKEKLRADLLRAVSHDIRTPLTSIVGSISVVLENPGMDRDQRQALLESAREEAQWLVRVMENLLSITRIGEDQARISKEPEAAEEVLGEAVRKFRRRFPGIRVDVSAPEALLLVPMDPILIEQVLSNLLENAAVHGGTTTRIALSLREEEGFARFRVQDDGRGIPKRELPGLFTAAWKTGASQRGDGRRNMGLGLSVCLAIVQAHGGTMEAKNLETGAEFSFRLPMIKEDV